MARRYAFFLGGYDLEMVTIRQLLLQHIPSARVHDLKLRWGAKASSYESEIRKAIAHGEKPVLVELENDLGLRTTEAIIVDHHGERAGEVSTSLEQIWGLLELPPKAWRENRDYQLIAANDRGHIRAMQELDLPSAPHRATAAEIADIRARDRAAQGITAKEEAQAVEAVKNAERLAEGELTVVTIPHSRTAAVTDRLHEALGGRGYRNLLILSPDEVNFFGDGGPICRLDRKYPGGWKGGELPSRGFWGHSGTPDRTELQGFLERHVASEDVGGSES